MENKRKIKKFYDIFEKNNVCSYIISPGVGDGFGAAFRRSV